MISISDNESRTLPKLFVSIVVPTHNRPQMLANCLDSLILQTSRDYEVIVVFNGAPPESMAVVQNRSTKLPALSTVKFDNNVWDWEDFRVYYGTVYKAGLEKAKGEFILFLSDDDALCPKFVELAKESLSQRADAVAFTGLASEVTDGHFALASTRPHYEHGIDLALRCLSPLKEDRRDLCDPGFGYVIKTALYKDPRVENLVWSGGYERSQILGLLPQGVVAYNPEARFVWGRHPNQTNKVMNARIGTLRQHEIVRRRENVLAISFWRVAFSPKITQSLRIRLNSEEGLHRAKFMWQHHPYDVCVVFVWGALARNPKSFKQVLETDGKELIFWLLTPRALATLLKRFVLRLRKFRA